MKPHFQSPAAVSCEGKDRMTSAVARQVAKRLPGAGASAYHCMHCNAWHVGHGQRKARLLHKRPARFYDIDEE